MHNPPHENRINTGLFYICGGLVDYILYKKEFYYIWGIYVYA